MFNSSKLDRFAIRKYAVGVCPVVIASLLFLGPAVSADQVEAVAEEAPVVLTDQSNQPEPISQSAPTSSEQEARLETETSQPSEPQTKTLTEVSSSAPSLSTVSREDDQEKTEAVAANEPQSVDVGPAEKEVSMPVDQSSPRLTRETVVNPAESSVTSTPQPFTQTEEAPTNRLATAEPKAGVRLAPGTGFRSAGMTRSATPAGVIGDDYPIKWKYADPEYDWDTWRLSVRNCTSFVGYRLSSANKFELPPAYGNAKEWGGRARSEGYRVDNTPVRGAVAWSEAAAENKWWGHVAWVAAVNGDMVTVEEYNYGNHHAYNLRTVHKSAFTAYIHFKDIGQSSFGSEPNSTSSMGTIHGLPAQGSYTFTQRTGVKNEPKLASPDRATYGVGETVNYDKVLESDNYVWISYMNYSGSRSYIAVKALSPNPVSATPGTRPTTGIINIQNQNPRTGDFDVIISNAYHVGGIQEVQVPIWSDKGGQDDIVWYRAQHQGGSTYKVSVQTSRHKNDTGTYHVHLYYVQNDGKQVGAGATSTEVTRQQVSSMTIAPSGVYHFTKTLPIKNQASMASPTLDYYYAGETVNYDRVVTAEGRQWLSYMSRSGLRRYIPLN